MTSLSEWVVVRVPDLVRSNRDRVFGLSYRGNEPSDRITRGTRRCGAKSGTRPEVQAVRVVRLRGCLPQRSGQMVQFRIAEWCDYLVLVDEGISQPARRPSGKGMCENGFGKCRIDERRAVRC